MSKGKKSRVFTLEFKVKILERMLGGESVSALARETKVGRNLLYYWKDAYVSGGAGVECWTPTYFIATERISICVFLY